MPPSLCIDLDPRQRARLLDIARQSLGEGLARSRALVVDPEPLDEKLNTPAAVFITLTRNGELRGCVGSLQALDPLAQAVANSAFNAAFRDRRFAPLRADELDAVRIEVSVLSEMEPIEADSRQALLEQLQPGIDGLLLQDRGYRSTFLPKVWDNLASPAEFLEHLCLKAGLDARYWSDTIRFHRYHTLSFAES